MPAAAAAVLLALAAARPPDAAGEEYAFVITTDYYSAAYYSTIEVLPPRTADVSISSVNTDAVAFYDQNEGMVFVVNRYLADNIQIVDPAAGFATVGQYSVGNGSNPHDIRLASASKAYVSRYEWKTLLICDPYTGDSLGVVDLSGFADSDGIPEMDRMEIVGDRVFVTLNSINRSTWLPEGPGKIAVIDALADTLVDADPAVPGVQPILLTLPNPYTELRYDRCRHELVVGCLGAWGVMDGGIEVIDPVTLELKRVVATEADLGGDVSDAVLSPGPKGYAVVMDSAPWPDNFARLVCFDRATGQVLDTLYIQDSGQGASLSGIELNRQGEVYLCDRDAAAPRVRIYDTRADTLLDAVDVGVPPYDIAFVQQAYADAAPEPHAAPPWAFACPNPARGSSTIRLGEAGLPGGAPARLAIYDITGRLVRSLDIMDVGSGRREAVWDGKDDRGQTVASGVYCCSIKGGRSCHAAESGLRIVLVQ
jgi:DNA-binding beta-propeller fold protein YncE